MNEVLKSRENRLRRHATREGFRLMKARARSCSTDDGSSGYMLCNREINGAVLGAYPNAFSASLGDIEEFLSGVREE